MKIMDCIGFKLEEVIKEFDENKIKYKIIETFDTKHTKLGEEVRVVNIKKSEIVEVYVAYF